MCRGSGPGTALQWADFPFLCVNCSWFVSSQEGSQQLWHALKPPDLSQSPTSRSSSPWENGIKYFSVPGGESDAEIPRVVGRGAV